MDSPPNKNAIDRYRTILDLQSNNAAAIQGLKNVGKEYIKLTKRAIANQQLQQAENYMRQAYKLKP